MTKKNYAIFFICLLMLFGASQQESFGFKPFVEGANNSMAMGSNTAQASIIVIALWFLFKLLRMVFVKSNQKEVGTVPSKAQSRWMAWKTVIIVVPLFALVFGLGTSIADRRTDAYNEESDRIERRILEYTKEQSTLAFPSAERLATLHILQLDSFKTIDDIKLVQNTLDMAMKELESFDKVREGITRGGESIIENSSLPEPFRNDMRAGFRNSMTSAETKKLQDDRLSAQRAYYKKVATLYGFLLEHFKDYKIDQETKGKVNIFFFSNANLVTYRRLISEANQAAEEYNRANGTLSALNDR